MLAFRHDCPIYGKIKVFNHAGTVDGLIDIVAYTIDHDHDDEYAALGTHPVVHDDLSERLVQGAEAAINATFTGLSAGSHTVSMWVRATNGGSGTNAGIDPGCFQSANITVEEHGNG